MCIRCESAKKKQLDKWSMKNVSLFILNCFNDFVFRFRFGAMHERAEHLDPANGKSAHRALSERELGRRLQGTDHHTSPNVLWQRSEYYTVLLNENLLRFIVM